MTQTKQTTGTCPSGHVDEYVITKNNNRYCKPCANKRSRGYLDGRSDKNTYAAWLAMKRRCDNPNAQNYYLYGGRGITYDPRWATYKNFLEDMGEKPSSDLSLDRVDNSRNYGPDNCRWATKWEQASNKRNNRHIEHNGESKTLSEWARFAGVSTKTLFSRLNVQGWPMDRAVSEKAFIGKNQTYRKEDS